MSTSLDGRFIIPNRQKQEKYNYHAIISFVPCIKQMFGNR